MTNLPVGSTGKFVEYFILLESGEYHSDTIQIKLLKDTWVPESWNLISIHTNKQ